MNYVSALTFTKGSSYLIVHLNTELDHHNVSALKDEIDKEFSRAHVKNIIFDLNKVSFMDSSGIGFIMGRYKNVQSLGGSILISGLKGDMERLFNISGMQKLIKTYNSIDEAVKDLKH